MKLYNSVYVSLDPKSRSCLCSLLVTMSLISGAYFICSAWLEKDSFTIIENEVDRIIWITCAFKFPKLGNLLTGLGLNTTEQYINSVQCKDECRPTGSEALPKGIITATSNLDMSPLTGPLSKDNNSNQRSLLAIAAGIKQKRLVNEIVQKFLREKFVVMLFHYDGIVNEWSDFEWNDRVIHVSAKDQTKWWFAKRFLHPDVVSEYEYIFLWDEDLGVENFHPERYLSIIKKEGLEISQPGLDLGKSEVHHHITVRNRRSTVHRRYYRFKGGRHGTCDGNSTTPPCVGWVEMMAPVFSRAAWRCIWYMIQNDLIHAWGLDMQLGYCAQGDRTIKVGVVDEQYIVHHGLPTLGDLSNKTTESSGSHEMSKRTAIRMRSFAEMRAFKNRWNRAIKEDECWVDPYPINSG